MKLISYLSDRNLDPRDVEGQIRSDKNGAYVVFNGEVRNHSNEDEVQYLEFEAYESMAVKEMDKLLSIASKKWTINGAVIVHRVGKVAIGESAVVIAVGSAHRKEAFEACQFLIDQLKVSVPIWKKEYLQNGAVWVSAHP